MGTQSKNIRRNIMLFEDMMMMAHKTKHGKKFIYFKYNLFDLFIEKLFIS